MELTLSRVLCVIVAVLVFQRFWFYFRSVHRLPLPPGPSVSWFHRGELPSLYPWKAYLEWKKTYGLTIFAACLHQQLTVRHSPGDMVYLDVFGNPILVLNSLTDVSALLEKRSAKYSSRPSRLMVTDL
jgi:hypothetical protein